MVDACVDLAGGPLFALPAVQGLDRSPLDGLEDAGVDVGLQLPNQGHQVRPSTHPADAPAGHVVRLRQRVELEADLLGAVDLEDAERPVAVERDLRIRRVVAQHDAVAPAEADSTLEE